MTREEHNAQVAKYWSRVAKRKELGYWDVPGWVEHQNLMASGSPTCSWLDLFLEGMNPERALSLGCGSGSLERKMLQKGLCKHVEGCDISEPLLERARDKAKKECLAIDYFSADLNLPNFTEGRYDLIIGAGIFHHVENLEGLFANLKRALKPKGKLLVYDYVGPSRFQWTEPQIERCNQWLNKLPSRFKKKQGYPWHYTLGKALFNAIPFAYSKTLEKWVERFAPKRVYSQFLRLKTAQIHLKEVVPPPIEQFFVTDPSEAIRSAEILPVVKEFFTIKKLVPLGGTLAQPIFGRTVANFIKDREGPIWANQILEDERNAILQGELPSDFVAFIAE